MSFLILEQTFFLLICKKLSKIEWFLANEQKVLIIDLRKIFKL